MDKFDMPAYKQYSDLPLSTFDKLNYSVYVLDKEWNYLYVNKFVQGNLAERVNDLIGKNMWVQFPQLTVDSAFILIRSNSEKGIVTNLVTTSPLTGQRLHIVGYPLADCYFFFSSILPDKEELLHELRNVMGKKQKRISMKSESAFNFFG